MAVNSLEGMARVEPAVAALLRRAPILRKT
jgi:hypothetical protein